MRENAESSDCSGHIRKGGRLQRHLRAVEDEERT